MSHAIKFDGSGVSSLLDREYRNAPKYQWARELLQNGIEAGAERISFDVEWQGVKNDGVYRNLYADDGQGMSRDELKTYMSTLGVGGKDVGGVHENFAVGCRLTLLPWNKMGVVVISMQNGEANMIQMYYDAITNEYALWEHETEDGTDIVTRPFVDHEFTGIDYEAAIPDFVKEAGHGTVFILLGNDPDYQDHTVLGDPGKGEDDRNAIMVYLNTRYLNLNGLHVEFLEFLNKDKRTWPKSPDAISIFEKADDGTTTRKRYAYRVKLSGMNHFLDSETEPAEARGVVQLKDAKAYWYLFPAQEDGKAKSTKRHRALAASISLLYRNETYAVTSRENTRGVATIFGNQAVTTYNKFGINASNLRSRVAILIEPREYDEHSSLRGIASGTSRADVYWNSSSEGSRVVSPMEFAEEFSKKLPDEIRDELFKELQTNSDHERERQMKLSRVLNKYMTRWSVNTISADESGTESFDPTSPVDRANDNTDDKVDGPQRGTGSGRCGNKTKGTRGDRPSSPEKTDIDTTNAQRRSNSSKRVGIQTDKDSPSAIKGKIKRTQGGMPDVVWVNEDEMDELSNIVQFDSPNSAYVNGIVKFNKDHDLFVKQFEYWTSEYVTTKTDVERKKYIGSIVEQKVKEVYEESVISRVAHIDGQRDHYFTDAEVDELLSAKSLSASVMGLMMEDHVISTRLGVLGARVSKR